jgi:prefoldin subunit 5
MVDRTELQRLAQEVEVLRKRLEEINLRIEQVDVVLAEHDITETVLANLLSHGVGASISTHLPIGSGVSLPYRHQGVDEGVALVDLGSGVFGERPWSEAKAITEVRHQDIQHLRNELNQQAEQTERALAQTAQAFNTLAEQMKQPAPTNSSTPEVVEDAGEDEPSATSQRRPRKRGMFGSDLTLDD